MISFKSFVKSIQEAIISANNSLMDKNEDLIDKYFEEKTLDKSENKSTNSNSSTLIPKNVVLEYPTVDSNGGTIKTEIQVPLITLVPLQLSQIEKATLSADFELSLSNDELQINFPMPKKEKVFNKHINTDKSTKGKLEIVISPQESSEGLKLIVESYEAALKRQLQ